MSPERPPASPDGDAWRLDDFAVVDVETNGFSRDAHDVVEIAIVRLAPPRVVFESLVKPRKRIGNRQIHGITNRDIRKAPTFGQLAGAVADHLVGRVVVAHNASFDLAFLTRHLGVSLPWLCTMALNATVSGHRRDLETACRELGVPFDRSRHSASEDALAAGRLLQALLARLAARGVRSLHELAALTEAHGTAIAPPLTAERALAVEGRNPPQPRST